MGYVNIHDAKTRLSQLLEAVESGAEAEIIIARNGKPVGRLTAAAPPKQKVLWGVARGLFTVPDTIDRENEAIAKLFGADD